MDTLSYPFLRFQSGTELTVSAAWKLAHTLRGWSSHALLETYEVERRSYARGLIAFDKELAKMMNEGNASRYDEMSKERGLNTTCDVLSFHIPAMLTVL